MNNKLVIYGLASIIFLGAVFLVIGLSPTILDYVDRFPTAVNTLSSVEKTVVEDDRNHTEIAYAHETVDAKPTIIFKTLVAENLATMYAQTAEVNLSATSNAIPTDAFLAAQSTMIASITPLTTVTPTPSLIPVATNTPTATPDPGLIATQQFQFAQATVKAQLTQKAFDSLPEQEKANQRIQAFLSSISSQTPIQEDSFNDDRLGWTPKGSSGYTVGLENDYLRITVDNSKLLPFPWMCDACGPYQDFAVQVDIRTPKYVGAVLAGIFFGAPESLISNGKAPFYSFSVYSSGAFFLRRISPEGDDPIDLWDKRTDLITPDGEFHTLQVIAVGNYVTLTFDHNTIVEARQLDQSTNGYIGVVVQTAGGNTIDFDNLVIYAVP